MAMNLEQIIHMDQLAKNSELKGYLVMRWMDRGLTWNPDDWAGIQMI